MWGFYVPSMVLVTLADVALCARHRSCQAEGDFGRLQLRVAALPQAAALRRAHGALQHPAGGLDGLDYLHKHRGPGAHRRVVQPARRQHQAGVRAVDHLVLVRAAAAAAVCLAQELLQQRPHVQVDAGAGLAGEPAHAGLRGRGRLHLLGQVRLRLPGWTPGRQARAPQLSALGCRLKSSIKGHLIYICIVGSLGVIGGLRLRRLLPGPMPAAH